MTKKRIYIAGSGGMLGLAAHKTFKNDYELRCTDKDVNEDWLAFCDFRDRESYRADVLAFNPDVLIHLGAHTDLEYCESNPDDAYRTNTLSVEYAFEISRKLDIPLVYISTAGIFDGEKQLYDDWDTPNPLGVYARAKYLGEKLVQRHPRHIVCRAGWMMGGGAKDKKFIAKLMKQIAAGATELRVVDDKLGTPTYTYDFMANLKLILESEHWGLYNMVCGGETGRLEVAQELVRVLGREGEINVIPVPSSYFAVDYSAPRPPSERLVNYRLNLLGLNQMRDWKIALKEYVEDAFSDFVVK